MANQNMSNLSLQQMVDILRQEIARFSSEIPSHITGIEVEQYSANARDRVIDYYLPIAYSKSENEKKNVVSICKESFMSNPDHGHIRRWGRAVIDLCEYVLLPSSISDVQNARNLDKAVDAVVRISRWFHSKNNFWKRFVPDASRIVRRIWGKIEILSSDQSGAI
jgi:hypothetical protein